MTKDLAILISSDQKWLNTQDFLEALKSKFGRKIKNLEFLFLFIAFSKL